MQIRTNKRASVVCWNRFHQAARYLPTNSDAYRKVMYVHRKLKEKTSKVSQASQESPKKPKLLSRAGNSAKVEGLPGGGGVVESSPSFPFFSL